MKAERIDKPVPEFIPKQLLLTFETQEEWGVFLKLVGGCGNDEQKIANIRGVSCGTLSSMFGRMWEGAKVNE